MKKWRITLFSLVLLLTVISLAVVHAARYENLSVGVLDVSGQATFTTTIVVQSESSTGSTFTTLRTGDLFVEDDANIADDLTVTGTVTVVETVSAEQLTSTDDGLITDDLHVGGDTRFGGSMINTGAVTVVSTLTVQDAATFASTVAITGTVTAVGTVTSAVVNAGSGTFASLLSGGGVTVTQTYLTGSAEAITTNQMIIIGGVITANTAL